MVLDFFVELMRGGGGGGGRTINKLVDLLTKNSANWCNFKNPVPLRVMIFAELYLHRTLELFN